MFYGREMSGLGSSVVHFTLGFLLSKQLAVTLVGVCVCVCACACESVCVWVCGCVKYPNCDSPVSVDPPYLDMPTLFVSYITLTHRSTPFLLSRRSFMPFFSLLFPAVNRADGEGGRALYLHNEIIRNTTLQVAERPALSTFCPASVTYIK